MKTVHMSEKSGCNKSEMIGRSQAGRLIRQALTAATFVAAVVILPQTANAATITADGGTATDTITINNNAISSPPGGTLVAQDSVRAINGGTLSIVNNSSVTNTTGATGQGLVTSSGAGSTVTADDLTVNNTSANVIVSAIGGGVATIGNSIITGTLSNSGIIPPPGQGIQVVEARNANSVLNLNDSTVNTFGYDNNYYSTGISAYDGGVVNLNDVILNSTGDKTYGIWAEADNGTINGTNVTITTDGNLSHGVAAYGSNSEIDLTGGSITTNGTNSAGVQVNSGSSVKLTDMTVTVNDPTSYSVSIVNGTSTDPGTVTADNTILNGDVISDGYGVFNLTNNSVLNGSIEIPTGNVSIDSSSTWNDTENSVLHNFTNGNYVFTPPTNPSDLSQYNMLTVDNFIANPGSTITMNVFADGDDSLWDQVVINDSYSGSQTQIIPIISDGSGDLPGDGLVLVQGDGSSFADGDFFSDPVNSGFYTYTGEFDNTSGDSQFLLLSQLNSTVVGASVLPALGARTILSTLPSVQDRMHAPRLSVTGTGNGDAQKGIWARLFGGSNKFRSDRSADNGFDTSLWAVQAGYDLMANTDANGGRSYAGLYLAYGSSSGDAQLNGNDVGSLDLDATSVGAYWTKYTPSDVYLSITGQYSWLKGIEATGAGESIDPGGSGFAISLEAGKTLNRDKSMLIEPQAQLIYSHTDIDDAILPAGPLRPVATEIRLSNLNAVTGRLGVLFQKNPNSGDNFLPWARINLWHTFSGSSTMSSPGLDDVETSMKGTSAELTAGFNLLGSEDSRWAIDVAAGYMFNLSGAKNTGWRGNLGARYNF